MSISQNYPNISPSLSLDFANVKALDPRIAFTRASTGTFYDANGLLRTADANVARFQFDPDTYVSEGLLVEEQRTNLLLYSEEFDDAYWTKLNATVMANQVIAPDGTLTMDKLISNSGSVGQIRRGINSGVVTASIFAKAAEFEGIRFGALGSGGAATFNLSTGLVTSTSGTTSSASMVNVGNGIYRCVATWNQTSNNTLFFDHFSFGTGDGFSGIFIWGAQLEEGAFPTSYIKTEASQVTRAADSASMVGANFSEWYRPDEGSLFVSYQNSEGVTTNGELAKFITNINNYMSFRAGGQTTGTRFLSRTNGTIDVNVTLTEPTTFGTASAMFAYKFNDFAVVNNSGQITTDTSALVPVVDTLVIGRGVGSASQDIHCNTTIKKISYYPARLTNEQLQALTS